MVLITDNDISDSEFDYIFRKIEQFIRQEIFQYPNPFPYDFNIAKENIDTSFFRDRRRLFENVNCHHCKDFSLRTGKPFCDWFGINPYKETERLARLFGGHPDGHLSCCRPKKHECY